MLHATMQRACDRILEANGVVEPCPAMSDKRLFPESGTGVWTESKPGGAPCEIPA